MRPKKKLLSLQRETIRQLASPDLTGVYGAFENITSRCPTYLRCPTFGCPTQRHSCFDSCRDSDCCLEIP